MAAPRLSASSSMNASTLWRVMSQISRNPRIRNQRAGGNKVPSARHRDPDCNAAFARAWVECLIMTLKTGRLRGCKVAFRKPFIPDRGIGLGQRRDVAVMREDRVTRGCEPQAHQPLR